MNAFKSRMSFDIQYSNTFKAIQQNVGPLYEAQKLIQYLKLNPNPDINRKLREQIFFKNIMKPVVESDQMKRSSSQNRIQQLQNLSSKNEQKKNYLLIKTQNRKRGGFFSPKATQKNKQKVQTSPFVLFKKQISQNNEMKVKNLFKLRRDVVSLNQQLVQSQKQLPLDKNLKQCPQFLKKSPKTMKQLPFFPRQFEAKIHDFVIFKNLGQGTFGQVYGAFHKISRGIFTIKKYKKQIIKAHQLQDKFIHDIKVQLKMNHPHIVKLYGFFDDEAHLYMIFEYMQSGNLTKTIEKKGGKLAQTQINKKIYQINQALLYLHQQRLIHRDIKPASILTCLNICKLCDTQWLQGNDSTTHHNTLCKQIDYTAPEAFQGKELTPQFDVWGLGLIAFQLLTGNKLIQGNTQKIIIRKIVTLNKQQIQALIPEQCSDGLRNLIISSLEPVPSRRLKSSKINEIKMQGQKQLGTSSISNKTLVFSQKIIGGSPKNGLISGVKKQVSTLL